MNEWIHKKMNKWMNKCMKHVYKGERNIDLECFQRSYENMTDRSNANWPTDGQKDRQTDRLIKGDANGLDFI